MNRLSTKHFIGLEHATTNDIELIINTALTFREILDRPIKKVPSLKGTNIVNLLRGEPDSLRYREFIPFMIAEMKKMRVEIDELKARLDE